MPSNPCLHMCVQDVGSITEEEIQYTHCAPDVECGVITPHCFIQRKTNVTLSSSVLQVSVRGDNEMYQGKLNAIYCTHIHSVEQQLRNNKYHSIVGSWLMIS